VTVGDALRRFGYSDFVAVQELYIEERVALAEQALAESELSLLAEAAPGVDVATSGAAPDTAGPPPHAVVEKPAPFVEAIHRDDVIPIFATVIQLPPSVSPRDIREEIALWALPASDREGVDLMLPSHETSDRIVLSDEDPSTGLFALRFDHRTPAFTFRTEIVLLPGAQGTVASIRLHAIRVPGTDEDVEPSVPRIVHRLSEMGATHVRLPIGKEIRVASMEDVDGLAALIFNRDRVMPVLAVFGGDTLFLERLPAGVRAAFLVVHVPHTFIPVAARVIGRDLIGFNGALRIYPAGVDRDSSRHEVSLILKPADLPAARLSSDIRHTLWRLSRQVTEDDAPSYLAARRLILERLRKARAEADKAPQAATPPVQPATSEDAPDALRERITALEARLAEVSRSQDAAARRAAAELEAAMKDAADWHRLAEDAAARADGYRRERDDLRKEVYRLRQGALAPATAAEVPDAPPSDAYPDNFADLGEWVDSMYGGRVLIASKALRAARAALSEPDVIQLAYEAIDLLATDYLDAKAGVEGARERLMERQERSRLEVSKVGTALNNHRYADEYQCVVGKRRFTTDMHVKQAGVTSFNPARHLRVYFAHDADNGRIVIGHLPTHLTSTLS
jgi:hypothetical protein